MKNFLLLLLLCSFSICTNAQKIRFTDSTNVWHVAQSGWDYISTFFFGSEILLEGKQYRQVIVCYINEVGDTTFVNNQYIIREDTVLSRIYYKDLGDVDIPERLLYSNNLTLGDTVQFSYYTDSVVAIDSLLIDGYYYKVITLRDAGSSTSLMHAYTYIEGIGSLRGPLYPLAAICFSEYSLALCCFQNKGEYPDVYLEYQNCQYDWSFNNDNCTCILPPYSGVNYVSKENIFVEIFPNPLENNSLIKWKETIERGLLQVTDATGRIMLTQTIQNASSFPIGQLLKEAGIYFYELRDIKNKRSARGKMILM